MQVPDYRRTALQYYDGFGGVTKDRWTTFLDGCDQGMFLSYEGTESD
jgi:hypothetical protein